MVAAGEGNEAAQAQTRRRTKATARRAGAPQVDCRRIKVTSTVTTKQQVVATEKASSSPVYEGRLRRALAMRNARQSDGPWAVCAADRAATTALWDAPSARDGEVVQEGKDGLAEVTVRDLKTARPGICGNDALVNGLLTLMAEQHGGGTVQIVNSYRVEQIRSGASVTARTIAREKREGSARGVCTWLYPVNIPGAPGHWMLWVIDRDLAGRQGSTTAATAVTQAPCSRDGQHAETRKHLSVEEHCGQPCTTR